MRLYDTVHPMVNLPALPEYRPLVWTLDRRLARCRANNPRTTTGRGAARRSAHEHELDELCFLAWACRTPGVLVEIGRRRNGGPIVRRPGQVEPRARRRALATVEPYRLLHEPIEGQARAARGFRALLGVALDWWAEFGPHHGWAERQSARRAARQAEATSWYLPRRMWPQFTVARAVARWIAAALLTLHEWWDALIPAPRSRSEAEGRGAGARASASPARTTETRCRDQRAEPLGAMLRRLQLTFGA